MGLDGVGDERLHVALDGDVDLKEPEMVAGIEIGDQFATAIRVQIADDDGVPVAQEPLRGSSTDPASTARDDRGRSTVSRRHQWWGPAS